MQLTEAQDRMVQAIAAAAPAGWERIVADIEIIEEPEGFAMDTVCFALVKDGAGYAAPGITLDRAARGTVADVYKAIRATRPDAVPGTLELKIEPDGRYKLDVDYGAPKRLNGEWDEEKERRLDTYAERFAAERAAG